MNKNLKKLVSSLMAFVMVLSSMVFANVSSVMAADGDAFTILPADFYSGKTLGYSAGGKVDPATTSFTKEGATVTINSGGNFYGAVKSDSYVISKGKTLANATDLVISDTTEELCFGGNRTITIKPAANGTISFYWYDGGARNVTVGSNAAVDATNFTVTKGTASCTKGTDFAISGGTNVCMLAITFTPSSSTEESDTTYYWSLDTSSLTSLGLTGTLALSATTTSTTNKLTYSGTDYKLNKTSVTSADATSGSGTESAPYVIKADASWFTVSSASNVVYTYSISDLEAATYTDNFYSADNKLKFIATSSKNLVVDANSQTFTIVNDTSVSATKRLKTGGTGKTTERAVSFTPASDGTVYFYAMSGNTTSERALAISDGTTATTATTPCSGTVMTEVAFDVTANKTYYVYSSNSGINIYYIASTVDLVAFTPAETTTESTTESTTEATTKEDSTETTTAVSGGITYPNSPVPMGTYDDFTALDTNYFYLSSGCTAGNNIDIPVGGYVSFVVNTDCTMSFTIGNKAMYVVDESGNKTSYKTGDQTISLTAGRYYLESADASKYTRIKNSMVFESTTKYDVTPTFSVTEAATSITVNGQAYTAGTALQLTAGSYPVVYVVGTTTYKGTLVVNSDGTYATVQLTEAGAIKLYNGETLIDGYDTIAAAVEAASAGNTIKVPAGEYNEKLTLSKSITIESLSGNNDVTIYYNGGAQTSLGENATIKITTADGVTLKNLTVKNTYNLAEQHTAKSQAPAINVDKTSFNNVFTNCSIESVQDTLLFRNCGNSSNTRATLNNCTVIGETDFVCGTGIVNFNNCSFNIACYKYNNSGAEVASGTNAVYVFSPTPYSTFNVNNGSIGYDTKYNGVNVDFNSGASTNVYYARVWDKSSINSTNGETVELYLNGVSTNVSVNKTNKSLNGFYCQSINGRIPTTSVWFNIYNTYTENPTNTKGSYDYSTHDANLFQYKGYVMEDGMLYLYGDFMAGTGTGFVNNSTTVDPVLNDIESIGILVGSNTKTDTNTVANTYVFTKLKNGTADVCTGNPYAAFVAIDFTDVTDYSTVGTFDVYTYTKYVSSDDYCVSSDSYSVTVTDANTASVQ